MSLVLDAGAFIAVERGDRELAALIAAEHRAGTLPLTHGGVVGQVWRGDPRQALLARLLRGVDVQALDDGLGRLAGVLLALTSTADVIDAALVALAADGDRIATSDPEDLIELAAAGSARVYILPV